jgi:predicted DNA-binding transcriptional regulator
MITGKNKEIYNLIMLHDLGIRFHAIESMLNYDRLLLKPRLDQLIDLGLIRKEIVSSDVPSMAMINDMYYPLSPTEIIKQRIAYEKNR